jgi:outer membrane protein assembly factor BamB
MSSSSAATEPGAPPRGARAWAPWAAAATALVLALAAVLLLRGRGGAAPSWPAWRGPRGDARGAATGVPTEWSPTRNVVWRAPVPGRGHSSPVVCGEDVFVTTADQEALQQRVAAFDRRTGRPSWSTLLHEGGFMRSSARGSHASSTPACDGRRVYAAMANGGSLWLSAVGLEGRVAWQSKVGPFYSEHGYGSSVALHENLVIVSADNPSKGFLAAVDRDTGKTVWETPRTTTGYKASYGSPIVGRVAGRTQLLVVGLGSVSGYDPEDGRLVWRAAGTADATVSSPAFSDQLVFASGGDPRNEVMAVRGDGQGDVSATHVAWRSRRGVAYVPSPVLVGSTLVVVTDEGIVNAFDAATGEVRWQARLEGDFLSSPVVADGHVFVTNDAGTTFVFDAGERFTLLARNDMGSGGKASPALDGGHILLRTDDALFCIGAAPAGAAGG